MLPAELMGLKSNNFKQLNNLIRNKIFLDKDQMQNVKFSKDLTGLSLNNKSFVRSLLTSVREKINDPLGKKRRKIKSN